MLEEALELFNALETNDRTTFHGRYYQLGTRRSCPSRLMATCPV